MPRARNIKPSFFVNEYLAESDPLARILFIGMWTIADYKGDFEWRPKRIKLQILPYDDVDIDSLAINLDKSGFIRFYSDGEKTYIRIVNFLKHQNPHKNERDKGSEIPEYSEEMRQAIDLQGLTINRDKSGENPEQNGTNHADSLFLNPDSCSPLPELSSPNDDQSADGKEETDNESEKQEDRFQEFWDIFADKRGREAAEKTWRRKRLNKKADEVIEGARKYVKARGPDKKYWKQAQGWLNDGRWEDEIVTNDRSPPKQRFLNDEAYYRDNRSRAQKVSDTIKAIAAEDIAENGYPEELD